MEELTGDLLYGQWNGYGVPVGYMLVNPMQAMMFGELDLKLGKKMSSYGQGMYEASGLDGAVELVKYERLQEDWKQESDW